MVHFSAMIKWLCLILQTDNGEIQSYTESFNDLTSIGLTLFLSCDRKLQSYDDMVPIKLTSSQIHLLKLGIDPSSAEIYRKALYNVLIFHCFI